MTLMFTLQRSTQIIQLGVPVIEALNEDTEENFNVITVFFPLCYFVGWPSSALLLLITMYLIVQTDMELNRHISDW